MNAGAIHADLLAAGRHPEQIGSRWFSWHDFKVFLDHMPQNGTSALFRAVRPDDWMFHDPVVLLLSRAATSLSRMAASMTGSPVETFGPPSQEAEPARNEDKIAAEEKARRVAAEIRAELAG